MSINTYTMSVTGGANITGARQFCIETLEFLDTIITEFIKIKNWKTNPSSVFPKANANALAENLIPQWVADSYNFSSTSEICGFLEFELGGTKYCFVTFAVDSTNESGDVYLFIKTQKEFKYHRICTFNSLNSTSVLYSNENLIVFIAQKANKYFIFKIIGSTEYASLIPYYFGTIHIDKPTNTLDTNCFVTFGFLIETAYNTPFGSEDINIPVSIVTENLIPESDGFIVNNYDNTIPLYRVYVGDNINGIRGEIGYLKTAPYNYKTGFSVINNVAGESYIGAENLGLITNANSNVLLKLE